MDNVLFYKSRQLERYTFEKNKLNFTKYKFYTLLKCPFWTRSVFENCLDCTARYLFVVYLVIYKSEVDIEKDYLFSEIIQIHMAITKV
jgi:hypothetical protein